MTLGLLFFDMGSLGKRQVRQMSERLRSDFWSWLSVLLSNGLTTVGLLAMILGTSPTVGESGHQFLFGTVVVVWGLITAQFIVGFLTAPAAPGRCAYLASAEGLIDLAAGFALPLGWLLTSASSDALLFIWVLSEDLTIKK
jgi:voltage-gated potassium channel